MTTGMTGTTTVATTGMTIATTGAVIATTAAMACAAAPAPNHDIWVGRRLPNEYRSRYYVVDDWRGHRLSSPPRGYHWVQSGSDYLLVAVATGLIASAILNN